MLNGRKLDTPTMKLLMNCQQGLPVYKDGMQGIAEPIIPSPSDVTREATKHGLGLENTFDNAEATGNDDTHKRRKVHAHRFVRPTIHPPPAQFQAPTMSHVPDRTTATTREACDAKTQSHDTSSRPDGTPGASKDGVNNMEMADACTTEVDTGSRGTPSQESAKDDQDVAGATPRWMKLLLTPSGNYIHESLQKVTKTTADGSTEHRVFVIKKAGVTVQPGTHMLCMGLPRSRTETCDQQTTPDAALLFYLRDTHGRDEFQMAGSNAKEFFGCRAVSGGPQCNGADLPLYMAQSDNPNCVLHNNVAIAIRTLREGEECTVPHNIKVPNRVATKEYALPGFPIIGNPTFLSNVPLFTAEETAHRAKALLASLTQDTAWGRQRLSDLHEPLEEARELGFARQSEAVARSCVTLSAEQEDDDLIRYATYFNDLTWSEEGERMEKVASGAMKQVAKETPAADHDYDRDFRIFELIMHRVDVSNKTRTDVQIALAELGARAAHAHDAKPGHARPGAGCKIEKFINIALNTLLAVNDPERCKLGNVMITHLAAVVKTHGQLACVHVALWLQANNHQEQLTTTLSWNKSDYLKKGVNRLLLNTATQLGWLPLQPSAWVEALKRQEGTTALLHEAQGVASFEDTSNDKEDDTPVDTVLLLWNCNDLRCRLNDGGFAQMITDTNADTIVLTEVKRSPANLTHYDSLLKGLASLGYHHVHWNWCVEPDQSTNFGSMVISKWRLHDVKFGLTVGSHEDPQGRCISFTLGDHRIIAPYVPCPNLTGVRDIRRRHFDDSFAEHVLRNAITGASHKCLVVAGDINVIDDNDDISVKGKLRDTFFKLQEGAGNRHRTLCRRAKLSSAAKILTRGKPKHTWKGYLPSSNGKHMTPTTLRIDDALVRKENLGRNAKGKPAVVGFWASTLMFKSDHRPILLALSRDGERYSAKLHKVATMQTGTRNTKPGATMEKQDGITPSEAPAACITAKDGEESHSDGMQAGGGPTNAAVPVAREARPTPADDEKHVQVRKTFMICSTHGLPILVDGEDDGKDTATTDDPSQCKNPHCAVRERKLLVDSIGLEYDFTITSDLKAATPDGSRAQQTSTGGRTATQLSGTPTLVQAIPITRMRTGDMAIEEPTSESEEEWETVTEEWSTKSRFLPYRRALPAPTEDATSHQQHSPPTTSFGEVSIEDCDDDDEELPLTYDSDAEEEDWGNGDGGAPASHEGKHDDAGNDALPPTNARPHENGSEHNNIRRQILRQAHNRDELIFEQKIREETVRTHTFRMAVLKASRNRHATEVYKDAYYAMAILREKQPGYNAYNILTGPDVHLGPVLQTASATNADGVAVYTPYDDEGNLAKVEKTLMPDIALHLQAKNGDWLIENCLMDTGAYFNIISRAAVTRLGYEVKTHDDEDKPLQLPTLLLADHSRAHVTGTVDIPIDIGNNQTVLMNLFVMDSCGFPLIIGSHCMRALQATIHLNDREVRFNREEGYSSLPFKPAPYRKTFVTMITVAEDTVIPKETPRHAVPVEWGGLSQNDSGTFGFIADAEMTRVHVARHVAHSELAYDKGLCVDVANVTNEDITLKAGETLAYFDSFNVDDYHCFSIEALVGGDSSTEKVHGPEADAELETEWTRYPHLHGLHLGNMDPSTSRRMRWLLIKHQDLWSPLAKGLCDLIDPYKIDLIKEFKSRATRSMNPTVQKQCKEMTDKQLQKEVIEHSTSRFTSPIVLVPKKGGKIRFALNFQQLNKCIRDDKYPTPNAETITACVQGTKIFSTLDLTDAYWSIELAKESRPYTAFQSPDGLFQYKRLPQGLKTASAVFCRHMDQILGSLKWTNILVYVDDLLIFTETMDQHFNVLDKLFTQLRRYKMTLSPTKCYLVEESVDFLGHTVTTEGVTMNAEKVRAITDLQRPNTKAELKTRMFQMRYYRKFVQYFTHLEEPLRAKCADGTEWVTDDNGDAIYTVKEATALDMLQNTIVKEPVLAHADWSQPFRLHTDACKKGLGATCVQMRDGKEVVISFLSRSLTKAEAKYNIWELECLAMIWAARKLRFYLMGSQFTIITDSQAAKHIMALEKDDCAGRLLRWALALQDFDFVLEHRERKRHFDADGLSQCPLRETEPYREGPTLIEPATMLDAGLNAIHARAFVALDGGKAFFEPGDKEAHTRADFAKLQREDEDCRKEAKSARKSWKDCKPRSKFLDLTGNPDEALLMRKDNKGVYPQVVVPTTLRAFILRRYHGLPISGHLGINKVYRQIKRNYWWPNLKSDLQRWIGACATCVKRKATRNLHVAELGRTTRAQNPWETIAVDIVSPSKKSSEGYTKILTVLDVFSRWVLAIPLRKADAHEIGEALFKHVFCQFGKPRTVLSDQGSEFVNKALEHLYEKWNIENIDTGGYQPQANPVERYHRFLNASMTMLCTAHGSNWPEYLPAAVFSYNSSTCESTLFTPFELIYGGRLPTLLHDLDLAELARHLETLNEEGKAPTTPVFVQESKIRLHAAYIEARKAQEKMARRNKEAALNRQGPVQAKGYEYEVGEQIMHWEPQQTMQMQTAEQRAQGEDKEARPNKWMPKWTGPHTIKEKREHKMGYRYVFFHRDWAIDITARPNRMKPFQPWSDGIASTSWQYDTKRLYRTGEWVQPGSLVLVPLQRPYPFGVAVMIDAAKNGDLTLQWMGNASNNPEGTYEKGWLSKAGNVYYAAVPRSTVDTPYQTCEEDIVLNQRDVLMHDFTLTPAGKLPQPLLRAVSDHPKVWWQPAKMKKSPKRHQRVTRANPGTA